MITGRVADAAVVSGTAAWWHEWSADDLDALAGATVAGHAIECGTQVTGGNFAFFGEIADLTEPGFPIAEIARDGTSVITKSAGTGGAVTIDTVTAQLLYEIAGPRYPVPDVVARIDTVRLRQFHPDRIEISGTTGEPAPAHAKALLTYSGGYRNSMTLAITGVDRRAKADLAERAVWAQIPGGRGRFAESTVEVVGASLDSDASDDQSYLKISVADPELCGRGPRLLLCGRGHRARQLSRAVPHHPTRAGHRVHGRLADADRRVAGSATSSSGRQADRHCQPYSHPGRDRRPTGGAADDGFDDDDLTTIGVGQYVGARSGDKGGNANLGLWVRDERHWPLLDYLTTPHRLADVLPEFRGHDTRVYPLPNLLAVNVVIVGLLGSGVAASLREDPQAKSLGERFRAVRAAVPAALLPELIATEA